MMGDRKEGFLVIQVRIKFVTTLKTKGSNQSVFTATDLVSSDLSNLGKGTISQQSNSRNSQDSSSASHIVVSSAIFRRILAASMSSGACWRLIKLLTAVVSAELRSD